MSDVTRRELLGAAALTAAAATLPMSVTAAPLSTGRVKQSVCRWPFNKIPLPEFFKACAEMGLPAMELLTEERGSTAKLTLAHLLDPGLPGGAVSPTASTNRSSPKDHQASLEGDYPQPTKAGSDVITCFGNRRGKTSTRPR